MYDEMILAGDWDDPAGPVHRALARHPAARRARRRRSCSRARPTAARPSGQGEELYAALAAAGTEAELVVYPREGHVPVERAHALDAIRRTQEWFDRHLRPEG